MTAKSAPKVSVVIPVYNRQDSLRRVLQSIQAQTLSDFECLVVDDASTIPIEQVVVEMRDDRFIYLRNRSNGGPYNARTIAYKYLRGDYVFPIDSDEEAYPWALSQAAHYLDTTPEVDGVAGLYVHDPLSRLPVRVKDGPKIVTPEQYAKMGKIGDRIGVVRRSVVEEWLQKNSDYFAMESHQWMTYALNHKQLYVDEPWAIMNLSGTDRISLARNTRLIDDYLRFVVEHEDYIRGTPCLVLDQILLTAWWQLIRAGHFADARKIATYLNVRGLSRHRYVLDRLVKRLRERLGLVNEEIQWV